MMRAEITERRARPWDGKCARFVYKKATKWRFRLKVRPFFGQNAAAGAAATFWDGVLEVKMTARLNRDFPSDRRATLVSVQSMAYSLAMLPVSPLAGALCDRLGYSGGMAALGLGLLSLVAAGMAAHRCRKGRKRE